MNNRSVEVKSVLWQKLFILPVALLICAVGMTALLSPFVPIFPTTPRGGPPASQGIGDILAAVLMGVAFLAGGFCLWWTVFIYSIRADETGIRQTNGFFTQAVRWDEVDSYYMAPNRRYHGDSRRHVEPVMFDAQGKVVFQGFAHLLASTQNIFEQRRLLWQFVQDRLEGREKEKPSRDRDPELLAAKSLHVDWSKKSAWWKVGRLIALVLYALFWLVLSMLPAYYVVSRDITLPPFGQIAVVSFMAFCWMGPFVPHIIWLKLKQRKIQRELEAEDTKVGR